MAKDIDSVRVALESAFKGLPLSDQARLVADWLHGAFHWKDHERGQKFWAAVHVELHDFTLKR